MTEEKICPFFTRVTVYEGIDKHEYIIPCKKEKCMAWVPEREGYISTTKWGDKEITGYKGTLPGYCKLIERR